MKKRHCLRFILAIGFGVNKLLAGSSCNAEELITQDVRIRTSFSPTLRFDQTTAAGLPAQVWEMGGDEIGYFFTNSTDGTYPFEIATGAPSDSFVIDPNGKIGMGTYFPAAHLHVRPAVDLEATIRIETPELVGTANGQLWDLTASASGIFLTDFTSDTTPLTVESKTPSNTLYLSKVGGGHVGIGTRTPNLVGTYNYNGAYDRHLKLASAGGRARAVVEGTVGAEMYLIQQGGLFNRKVIRTSVEGSKYAIATCTDSLQSVEYGFCMDMTSTNVGIKTYSPAYPLQVGDPGQTDGGGAYVSKGGVWTNASSRELKQDIEPITSEQARKTVRALQPVGYRYKNEPDEGYVGFIAEDVPELVATKDRKSLAPMDVVAVLTKVVQDQDQLNQEQSKLLAQERGRNDRLEAALASVTKRLAALERKAQRGE